MSAACSDSSEPNNKNALKEAKNLKQQRLSKNKPVKLILSWLAVILWMILIFCLSAQVAEDSSRLSSGITQFVVRMITSVFPKVKIDIASWGFLVRKLAHFLSYLVLGVLVLNAFGRSGVRGYKRILFSGIICILYAATDEIHQLYVPGRGGQIRDVLIDSLGAGTGFILYFIICWFVSKKKKRKTEVLLDNADKETNLS